MIGPRRPHIVPVRVSWTYSLDGKSSVLITRRSLVQSQLGPQQGDIAQLVEQRVEAPWSQVRCLLSPQYGGYSLIG